MFIRVQEYIKEQFHPQNLNGITIYFKPYYENRFNPSFEFHSLSSLCKIIAINLKIRNITSYPCIMDPFATVLRLQ